MDDWGKKPSISPDYKVEHCCNPADFKKLWDECIKDHLPQTHLDLLKDWPFKHFLDMPQIIGTKNFLLDFFQRWDPKNAAFNYGGMLMHPTADEFSIILGLRARGRPINERPLKVNNKEVPTVVWETYFPKGPLSCSDLQKVVLHEMGPNRTAPPPHGVSMFTMLALAYILFSRVNAQVPMHLWKYVDNVNELGEYAWGHAVHRDTTLQFDEIAKHVREHILTGKGTGPGMQGCTFACSTWVYERTQPTYIERQIGGYPHYNRWIMTHQREGEFKKILASMTFEPTLPCELIPEYNEAWIFMADSDMANQFYHNPQAACTPVNIITAIMMAKIHAMIARLATHLVFAPVNDVYFYDDVDARPCWRGALQLMARTCHSTQMWAHLAVKQHTLNPAYHPANLMTALPSTSVIQLILRRTQKR